MHLYRELREKETLKELSQTQQEPLNLHSWNYPLTTNVAIRRMKEEEEEESKVEARILQELEKGADESMTARVASGTSTATRTPEIAIRGGVKEFNSDGQVGGSPRLLGKEVGQLKTWQFILIAVGALVAGSVLSRLLT